MAVRVMDGYFPEVCERSAIRAKAAHAKYNKGMEQVVKRTSLEANDFSARQPLVFLDTNVILGYLHGDTQVVELFSAEATGRIRFAVNPIVLQELLLVADAASLPEFEQIRDHRQLLPVNFAKAEALLPRVRALRNRLVHSNDILILSSAEQCDFLVTNDGSLMNLAVAEELRVVTPEQLVKMLQA